MLPMTARPRSNYRFINIVSMSELDVIFELLSFEHISKHCPNIKIFMKFEALGAQSEFFRLAGLGRRITLQSLYALRVIM